MRTVWWWTVVAALILGAGCSYFEPVPRARSGDYSVQGAQPATDWATGKTAAGTYSSSSPATRTWTGLSDEQIVALANEIKTFLGAPYLWGGSSPEGADCSGFVSTVFRRAWGLVLPRSAEGMQSMGEAVAKDSLRFSDLVFFSAPGVREVAHVGIYVAKGLFVHASPTKGVILSSLEEDYFREHYAGARRLVRYVAR
ncbi:MAG: C40 family peptidase [candidate division KSB1 bacterium]|nr:C40 family peptidase [candidate division KSB1 bacterium]